MSEKNRRGEYDRLIGLNRLEDICDSLIKEFGTPKKKKEKKKKKEPETEVSDIETQTGPVDVDKIKVNK